MEENNLPNQPAKGRIALRAVTRMEARDYRRFLYTAMFRRSAAVPGILIVLPLLAAFVWSYSPEGINWLGFLGAFVAYALLCALALCMLVELRNRQSRRDPEVFQRRQVYEFYEDRIKTYMEKEEGVLELPYPQLRQALEAKDYWVFFVTSNSAMMLRRADMKPGEADMLRQLLSDKLGDKYKTVGAGMGDLE